MRIFPHWWNPQKRELITTPDNAATVSAYRRQIEQDVHKLREIVRQLDAASQPYTLTDVVRLFQSDLASNGILEYLQKEILRLQDNNQYGTSRNYRRTLSSFSTFLKGTDVPLPAVDATLIGRYEKWLAQRNVRRNSSSFYMRILRAAYNKAVREKLAEQSYPFAQVYTGIAPTPKRAVSEETILQLQRLNLSGHPSLLLARDLFIFSYCTRGMAFVDMAYLKKSDIADGSITYYRHKTGQRSASAHACHC
ncbi:site-specific integrase [Phocaeicola fibrisolvens]|nr:site-specific integrase [Phocaeicola fibrisolvens]MCU6779763.1 site-specific integrase [Phocaeicola fibrisolvens]